MALVSPPSQISSPPGVMRRLTDSPFRVRANTIESGTSTYTEDEVNLPVAIVKGKVQAIETMKFVSDMSGPDTETNQTNNVVQQWTRESQTGEIRYDSDQLIAKRKLEMDEQMTTSGADNVLVETQVQDLTDGDGNGELLLERSIFHGVIGSGNSAAKRAAGYLLCHLVELTGDEAALQMFVDDS